MCAWIDRHLPDFLVPPVVADGLIRLESVKCAGELLLVTFALTGPRMESVPALQHWARRIGRSLGEHMVRIGEGVDWARLPERIVRGSHSGNVLMVYPVLAAVTGERPLFHDHALATLRAVSRLAGAGVLDMDVRFALQLTGARAVRPTIRADLLGSLAACSAAPRRRVDSREYTLTHAILYLTEFGRRSPGLPGPVRRRLDSYLAEVAAVRTGDGDLDIAAELLVSRACLGAPRDRAWQEALHLLASRAAPPHGAVDVDRWAPDTDGSDFSRDYHLVLVALLAVASGMTTARVDPGSDVR